MTAIQPSAVRGKWNASRIDTDKEPKRSNEGEHLCDGTKQTQRTNVAGF